MDEYGTGNRIQATGNIGVVRGVLQGAHFDGSAAGALEAMTDLASGARISLDGEMFRLNDKPFAKALRQAAARIPVRLLADTEFMDSSTEFVVRAKHGVDVVGHGAKPTKLHTKTLVADSQRGVMSTAAAVGILRKTDSVDFSAHVTGRDARLLRQFALSGMTGDPDAIRGAAIALARRGMYSNDPVHGLTLARDEIEAQMAAAEHSVYAGTKLLNDPESVRMLVAARKRGLDVLVETTSLTRRRDVRAARDAGLKVSELGGTRRGLHGNVIITDLGSPSQRAFMGTASLSLRGMVRADAGRMSRELGWATTDQAAIDVAIDNIASVGGSRIEKFARRQRG